MADVIRTINDKNHFPHLFNNYFTGKDIYLRTKNGNMALYFLGYNDGFAAFRIPGVKSLPDAIIVFVRHNTNTIYASLKLHERNEDTFVFLPVKFQIIADGRKEDRKLMAGGSDEKNVLYIYDIVSETVITNAISIQQKKVEKIIETAMFELKKRFEHAKIVFMSENVNDIRMKYILREKTGIFIPDMNSKIETEDEESFNYYIENIYKKDFQLNRSHQFISEATVPVMFRKIIPYGYVQVNSRNPISDGLLEVVKRIAIVVDQLFIKNNIFAPIKTRFLVSDVSRSGLSIVFKDRRLISYFRKESAVSFESMLPTMKRAIMGAVVKNVTFFENGIVKVGMQVDKIDPASRANVEEFLDKMGV